MTYKDFWLDIYKQLRNAPEYSPRGLKIKEIENFQFTGDTLWRFANFKERKLSFKYIIGELSWYLRGDLNDVAGITHYSKFWNTIKNKEIPYFNSNYGHYIFQENQLYNCIRLLKNDKDTRQAAIIISRPGILESETKDKICTYAISFRIRNNKLNMTVRMRSNDFVLGTQIDFFQFSVVHEILYVNLLNTYPELELGTYTHSSDSFHIYEKHYKMMEEIIDNDGCNFSEIAFPRIKNKAEADYLMNMFPIIEKKIRQNTEKENKDYRFFANSYLDDCDYKFTKICVAALFGDLDENN